MQQFIQLLGVAILALGLCRPVQGVAQTSASDPAASACHVDWNRVSIGDITGTSPSVSVDQAGAVVLIYAESGRVVTVQTGRVQWGVLTFYDSSEFIASYGYDPSISMNNDGLVMEVHADRPSWVVDSKMFLTIGTLASNGRSVSWAAASTVYDGGNHPQVAINDSGTVVEVHESNRVGSHDLVYRLGHIVRNYPRPGNFYLYWDSGSNGKTYDQGRYPHVALDNAGNVIEVHQATSSNNLHYRRGLVNNTGIQFAPSPSNGRYITGGASRPVVAMTYGGVVQEVHTFGNYGVFSLTGAVNWNTSNVVDWASPEPLLSNIGTDYSLSTNGSVMAFAGSASANNRLYFRVGDIHC